MMVWFLELYSCLFFSQHVCISGLVGLQRWPRLSILCFNINNTNFLSIILITGPSSALQWGPQCGLENVSVKLHGIINWPQPLTVAELLLSTYCFPDSSDGKASASNTGHVDSIPGSGRSPREGNGNPLQYSCLESSMDRGAWWATELDRTKQLNRLTDRLKNGPHQNLTWLALWSQTSSF